MRKFVSTVDGMKSRQSERERQRQKERESE